MNCHGPVTKLKIGTFFMSGYMSCNINACFTPLSSKYSAGIIILVSKVNRVFVKFILTNKIHA